MLYAELVLENKGTQDPTSSDCEMGQIRVSALEYNNIEFRPIPTYQIPPRLRAHQWDSYRLVKSQSLDMGCNFVNCD